jgi:DNA polymerase I-like protein with 3'-5' exonuclease and polymerase domains
MIYRLHPAASGRPIRHVYQQAAGLELDHFEVVTSQDKQADIVAGAHEIYRETGLSLGGGAMDTLIRGSILPAKDGRWVVGTFDPRSAMTGNKKWGYKNQTDLVPLTKVDIYRAKNAVPQVPRVSIRSAEEVLALYRESRPKWLSVDIEGRVGAMHLLGVGWDPDQAYVIPWDESCIDVLSELFEGPSTAIFHNANYDVAELWELGVEPPADYVDTIVLGHMYNPSLKKGLQPQVLSWVEGSTAWKGLVDHKRGYQYAPPNSKPAQYRAMWKEIILRLGRNVPKTEWHWYCFYNGLDVAYTYRLNSSLRHLLGQQGQRLERYDTLERQLQPYLVSLGYRGMPVNPATRDELVAACRQAERDAYASVAHIGHQILEAEAEKWEEITWSLKRELQAAGAKLSSNKEYCSARNKMNTRKKNLSKGFKFTAPGQKAALVYDHLGLPTVGREGRSTRADVLEELKKRMLRRDEKDRPAPSAAPTTGTIEDAVKLLDALIIGTQNGLWRRNFLSSKLVPQPGNRWPRMRTEYHLHRAATGRLSSGTNSDDDDKKEKKQQLQNVPEPLRRPVEADPGFAFVGGDWSNVEWAVLQVLAIRIEDWRKEKHGIPLDFHQELLDRFLRRDLDAHRYLASFAYRKLEEAITKAERKNCKSYTHGRNFFGSERALAAAAGHTLKRATEVCAAHAEAFKPMAWWESAREFVARHGYIETAYEWRRWFFTDNPKPTEIFGTEVQGGAADLCKFVLLDICRTVRPEWELLTTTHDSINMQVPIGDTDEAVRWLKDKMEQPIPFLDNVRFPADVSAGKTWMDV